MPVLFFSGGIDSTTLAYDIAKHPYRYGVFPEGAILYLVNVYKSSLGEDDLLSLARDIDEVGELDVVLKRIKDPLRGSVREKVPKGGMQVLNPAVHRYFPDVLSMPYTPGWMMWMAGIGLNLVAEEVSQVYNPSQVFFAHQFNGPEWEAVDNEELGKFDSSLEMYELLNALAKQSGENVRYRVPFLENRMDKGMIVQLAIELGVPLHRTSSCIEGWMKNCGQCCQCLSRYAVFNSLGVQNEDCV